MTIREEVETGHKPPGLLALAVALWLITCALSVVLIPVTLDLAIGIYAAFWADFDALGQTYWAAVGIRQIGVLALAMLAVAVTIGGAEYHLRHVGTARSWRLFARTLGFQLALLLMAWLV